MGNANPLTSSRPMEFPLDTKRSFRVYLDCRTHLPFSALLDCLIPRSFECRRAQIGSRSAKAPGVISHTTANLRVRSSIVSGMSRTCGKLKTEFVEWNAGDLELPNARSPSKRGLVEHLDMICGGKALPELSSAERNCSERTGNLETRTVCHWLNYQ
jgi:hypothetical protein